MRWIFLLWLISTKSSAQELFVFSEAPLLRPDAAQAMTCDAIGAWQDAAPLSPAIEQGSRMSLLIAVSHDPGKPFVLDVGQNPKDLLPLRLNRLLPGADQAAWPVQTPMRFHGRVFEGQRCALFLLEVIVPATTPVGRMKLEPAVWFPNPGGENFWVRYPMEVRVVASTGVRFDEDACPPQPARLGQLLLQGIPSLLGGCVGENDWPGLASRVREKRREQGKKR